MADVPFKSGKPGYLQLKAGANPTMNVMAVGGTGYTIGDNDVLESLAAAGAFGASPGNWITGMYTPVLDVICRIHPGWFTPANVLSLFGATADLSVRSDANGDLPFIDAKFYNGLDTVTDKVKLARMSIEGSAASNDILCRMTFLGVNAASAAVFGAFSATAGGAFYWKHVSATWTPSGGASGSVYGMERFTWGVSTGLSYGKWADGTDSPSALDPLADLAGAVTVTQRPGANVRMIASRFGAIEFQITDGVNSISLENAVNRQGVARVINPSGGLSDRIAYQMYNDLTRFCAVS